MQRLRSAFRYNDLALQAWCSRWHAREFAFFGSVVREDFRANSDIEVLIDLDPAFPISLFDLVDMQRELQQLFGRPVQVVERSGLSPWIGPTILADR